ncbi:MAG: HEPN domain-containing protein [Parcubacteria group bacterium Gr01-1014_44]|nr:MAG: HEPN domain-containing protein [Parcubacteria group bacterium Gr01-1014_44]
MLLTKYVQDWLARADEDIRVAEIALKEGGLPNPICFHAQQTAEKYLKGFLAFHEKHVRKIHDLQSLISECKKIDASFSDIETEAVYLTQFYTETRYPGDITEFTLDEADGAYRAALKIKSFVLGKIHP